MHSDLDWEITPEGLYRATRAFLIRRGYCCSNRCTNCPYINWRQEAEWRPLPTEQIRHARVSRRSVIGAQALLHYHQEALMDCGEQDYDYHQEMVEHYRTLLEHWRT